MKQNKEVKLEKLNLKNKNAITLIALVVTIVILLILAGISISLVLDNNGIISKSKDAKLKTRVSQVEDEVGLWKQGNFINKETDQVQEGADTMLESLISRKLLTEDEIDRENMLITIKKKDGSIVKEISYSQVVINTSTLPETATSGEVILVVHSVEGLSTPNVNMSAGDDALNNFVNSLSNEQKKTIIRNGMVMSMNVENPSANFTSFQDVLDWASSNKVISDATEDAFWNFIESNSGLSTSVISILRSICYNGVSNSIGTYVITNPNNEVSSSCAVTENGTYTFKVQDLLTGKIYKKEIVVTNVDSSLHDFEIDEVTSGKILLKNVQNATYTTFEKISILFQGELFEIPENLIEEKAQDNGEKNNYFSSYKFLEILSNRGLITSPRNLDGVFLPILIEKDNMKYYGLVKMVYTE